MAQSFVGRAPVRGVGLAAAVAASAACGGDGPGDAAGACPDAPGVICTWIGTGEAGFDGDGHGLLESELYWPMKAVFTDSGVYVLDWNNHRVRRVEDDGTLRTVIGTDFVGDGPDDLSDLAAPGADGTTVALNHPTDAYGLPGGDLVLVAWHNHKLRRLSPSTGRVIVTLGGPAGFAGDGGPMAAARVNQPVSAAPDGQGNVYLLDQINRVVRRIDADGTVSTVVGTPTVEGDAGDGGPPRLATLRQPDGASPGGGLALDAQGRLYIADSRNHRVRRVDFGADLIETVAGAGEAGFGGDGGPATAALLNGPQGLLVTPDGPGGQTLLIADELNHRIRAVRLEDGTIRTVAGDGTPGFGGDGGPAEEASLHRPSGLTSDPDGRLVIADRYNHRIRRMRIAQ